MMQVALQPSALTLPGSLPEHPPQKRPLIALQAWHLPQHLLHNSNLQLQEQHSGTAATVQLCR